MAELMSESILISTKKMLGIEADYTHFDPDIMMTINSVLMVLTQVGVGPVNGFSITGDYETWGDFVQNRQDLEAVKTYVYLRTRVIFDPPSNSFVMNAMQETIKELEWRLHMNGDDFSIEEEGEEIDE